MPKSAADPAERWMRAALDEARKGVGRTSPNPAVGAVIVRGQRIVARGWHRAAGQPHAEIEALRALPRPELARGATIVVTLEPCSSHGRTPPCTDAIIAAGFARVIYGATDPNPKHVGRAARLLRAAGLEVVEGVLAEECAALNPAFNHWVTTGRPWVIAKWAMSLDGRLNRPPGELPWLTSPAARRHAMPLRAQVDAILIGAGTLRADDPQLTVRGIRGARQPWRVVLTRRGELPADAKLFTDEHRERTLVLRGRTLRGALTELGRRGITSVLIEGGGEILGQAFDQKLVQEVCCFLAPLLAGGSVPAVGGRGIGDLSERLRLRAPNFERIGPDLCLRGLVDA
ncbi:MAG: bifunctional diaminohydroxyphosphoribosylaminopyrimidine deaminase/5-amino-6-(5-phosphoribosylamino)uracil reductase RibD [Verrucomicrobia bacterium]|nr:bifunctional diaminohydroxyphosphoribosylaminopyrimidine deaminase/5-amino-6-(5-phosphoribosylamino)uracil reductase RibD [Verrucomicrobiota bacterium]